MKRFGIPVFLLAWLAALLTLASSHPGARRRAELIWLRATGHLPDMTWSDVMVMMPPRSGYDVEGLVNLRNPFAAIENPYHESWDIRAGQQTFRAQCASCHGRDAEGGVGPDLAHGNYKHGASDWAIFQVIRNGVPGTAMQPHLLPRPEAWQIVAFLRSIREEGTQGARAVRTPIDSVIARLEREGAHRAAQGGAQLSSSPKVAGEHSINAGGSSTEWLTYSGTLDGQRHSALTNITSINASRLRPKWVFPLPSGNSKSETTPLVVGTTMFVTSPKGAVYAIDTRTGAQIWSFSARELPEDLRLCCGFHNRGVAAYGTTLYLGTLDAHLIALDSRTGMLLWEKEVANHENGYSITGAPLAVNGRVIIGVAGGEFGIRGFVDAYDATSGKRIWRTYTVPGPGEAGHDTWGGDSWKLGAAPTWMTGTFDPELNLVYWGVGNPGPNYQGNVRPGDNLYSNSVLAIDLGSGQLRWHFQFTPHDEHDWDATEIPILADAVLNGRPRKLLLEANRNGFYYVLDRETGGFISARAFVQQTWADSFDAHGRPFVRASSRPSARGSLVYPGDAGGTNWWAPSYDPKTQLFYVQARERAGIFFNTPDPKPNLEGNYMGSIGQSPPDLPNVMAVRALGGLSGELRWEYRPEGSEVDAGVGGLLSTDGNVVFGGSNSTFFALDARTGRELWTIQVGGAIWAAPITYLADGVQQVTIAVSDRVVTFSVDGR